MKRLLLLPLLLIPLYLFAQGFGSFSHDQPYFAADSASSGVNPYAVDLYEYWSFNTPLTNYGDVVATNNGEFGRDILVVPNDSPYITNGISGNGRFFKPTAGSVANAFFQGKWWSGYNSWTLSMWYAPYTETEDSVIWSIWNGSYVDQQFFLLSYVGGNLRLRAMQSLNNYRNINLYPTNTLPLSNWVYLALGYDATTTATGGQATVWFQTNAGPRISTYMTNVMPSFSIDISSAMSFGNVASGSQGFTGKMDEIGWWDRVLSTNEVTAFYGGGTNPIVYDSSWYNNGYIKPTSHTNLFDPTTISGFNFGYDALRQETFVQTNNIVGPLTSAIGITNWYSHSTNLMFSEQETLNSSGNKVYPTYYTNGFGTNGAKPRVNFADTGMRIGGLGGLNPNGKGFGQTNTFVFVFKPTNAAADASELFVNHDYTTGNSLSYYPPSGPYNLRAYHGNTALISGGASTISNNTAYCIIYQIAGGNQKCWTNGVVYQTGTETQNATLTVGNVGAYYNFGVDNRWHGMAYGDMPRFWCWGRILTDQEIADITAACREEYEF